MSMTSYAVCLSSGDSWLENTRCGTPCRPSAFVPSDVARVRLDEIHNIQPTRFMAASTARTQLLPLPVFSQECRDFEGFSRQWAGNENIQMTMSISLFTDY